MKASRKPVLALIGAMAMGAAMAAPSVEIVSVQQQYPWTNTVDIVYNVAGVASDTNGYFVAFTPTTQEGLPIEDINGETSIQVALSCTTNGAVAQWFPQTNQQYTACKMTPAVYRGGSGGGNDYMIVDLLTGAVTYEPMATQEASNQRYQAVEYKTTKLVLRRIPAGDDYYIGEKGNTDNINSGKNSGHYVSIPQDYYLAIYDTTRAQWNMITKEAADYTSIYPKGATWNTVRGSALPAAIPSKGVMADLNALTKLRGFDLPTASMYEIAARAGSTSVYITGDECNGTEASKYANASGRIIEVGMLLPNAWGFYDMCGNVWKITRDNFNADDLATLQPNGLVPITSGKSANCDYRSGSTIQAIDYVARFSIRCDDTKTWFSDRGGFRISYFPQ